MKYRRAQRRSIARGLMAGGLVVGSLAIAACSVSAATTASPVQLAAAKSGHLKPGHMQPRHLKPGHTKWRRPESGHAVLTPVDGGPNFYGKFSPSLPTSPSFFPIGVWFDSVTQPSDTASDQAAGINTYVQVTDNSDLSLIRAAGMYALINQTNDPYGPETAGWYVSDETDMWAGPGNALWTGNYAGYGTVCTPVGDEGDCGYTVQQTLNAALPNDNRLRYANYGKGVAFWETDSEASVFVNQYQNIVSDDAYWLTDDSICDASQGGKLYPGDPDLTAAQCHLPYNYALTVDRVRSLVTPSGGEPVWGFVELGHPFTEDDWPSADPAGVTAAVWQSLIAGARGIIYFNHSFGGPCQTQSALRDSCYAAIRTAVTNVDSQITTLAPVLNAPSVSNVATAGSGVDMAVKWYNGHFYILAGSTQPLSQTATFHLNCVGNAEVTALFENRTLDLQNGVFTDQFADGDAIHLYRIDGGSNCGA